jgi:hypothetical protein
MLDKQGDVITPRSGSADVEVRQPGNVEEKVAAASQKQDGPAAEQSAMAALPDDI